MNQMLASLALLGSITSLTMASTTWIVDPGSKLPTIQQAIDLASNGDTVLVMPGTYTSGGAQVVELLGKQITLVSNDGPELTIIDGEAARRCVVCISGESRETIIDGFTLTAGDTNAGGGGLYCLQSSPTVMNCIIKNNTAGDYGGGVLCEQQSTALLEFCQVIDNTAGIYGGGISAYKGSSPTISNCSVLRNTSVFGGGGLACTKFSEVVITQCDINENVSSYDGGGLYVTAQCTVTLIGGNILRNQGAHDGGGVYVSGGTIDASEVHIAENEAGSHGGGISLGAQSSLSGCTITLNTAQRGGGVFVDQDGIATITGCSITAGMAQMGGGIYIDQDSAPVLTNCDVSDNFSSGAGGGIYCGNNSWPEFNGCALIGNQAMGPGGGIRADAIPFGKPSGSFPNVIGCELSFNQASDGGAISSALHSLVTVSKSLICSNVTDDISGDWLDNGGNDIMDDCLPACPADVDGDGFVGVDDVLHVISAWGSDDAAGDIDGSGDVGADDLLAILSGWGPCS